MDRTERFYKIDQLLQGGNIVSFALLTMQHLLENLKPGLLEA